MPFADWRRPSFALSQLASLARREFRDEVETDVVHLNQDMAEYFGVPHYTALAGNIEHLTTGLGDWLFRDMAFPDLPENTAEYFRRYYVGRRWDEFRAPSQSTATGCPASAPSWSNGTPSRRTTSSASPRCSHRPPRASRSPG